MIIKAWQITKDDNINDANSGEGSRQYGGRWNTRGRAVIYTAGHASLAVLELLVHSQSNTLLTHYALVGYSFHEMHIRRIDIQELPPNWRISPAPIDLQNIGDAWIDNERSLILQVPSAVLPIERNYLINPEHPDFSSAIIGQPEKIAIDERLIR